MRQRWAKLEQPTDPDDEQAEPLGENVWQALLDAFHWTELLEMAGIDPAEWDQMTPEQRDRAAQLAMQLRNLHRSHDGS